MKTVTYSYDNRSGQATSLSSSVGDMIVSNATYTETGAPDQQLWGAGTQDIKAKWNYKADTQRLWKIKADTDTYGHTDLALLRYDYDLAGNITQLKDQKNTNQVQCFEYDDLYRLKRAWISDDNAGTSNDCADGYQATGTGWYDRSYNYDPLGNVDSWENHLNNNTYDYTYAQTGNAGLHAATALTGAGGGSFGYDQNGNQTSRPGGDTLVFDAANRLASYTTPTKTTTFAYDADGARIVRDEGATETIYIGGIYETDGTEKRSYYSFAGQVVAYRLQASSTDERYYLISDHLGTNAHQIKYSDSSRSSQYYLPYGGSRGNYGDGLTTDRTYTGQVSDETLTGLMFYNARYYDPLLRRFISPDTIVPDPGNPQDLNRYSYVRNNPVRYSDPTGNISHKPTPADKGDCSGCKPYVPGPGSGQSAVDPSSVCSDGSAPPATSTAHACNAALQPPQAPASPVEKRDPKRLGSGGSQLADDLFRLFVFDTNAAAGHAWLRLQPLSRLAT